MSGLDGYRNRVDSLAEARADRDDAIRRIRLAYAALAAGAFLTASLDLDAARKHLDALALKIKTEEGANG